MIVGFALAELLLLFLRFFRWFPNAPHGKPYSDEFARSMVVNFVFTNTSFLPMIIIEYLAYSVEPFNSDAENYKILGFAYITVMLLLKHSNFIDICASTFHSYLGLGIWLHRVVP